MAPLLFAKCGGTSCDEAIWLVFVAQGPGERPLWNPSAGGILPLPCLELRMFMCPLWRGWIGIFADGACQIQLRFWLGEGSEQVEDYKTDLARRWNTR